MQQQQQQQSEDMMMVICPSFSSYATNGLAAIAAKVTNEFRRFECFDEDDEDEFEFSLVLGDEDNIDHVADEVLICAGQIQIRPFPIIPNHNLIKEREIRGNDHSLSSSSTIIGIPLRELFLDDREERFSSTSSSSCDSSSIMEEEELEMESTNISAKAHCFWRRTPKSGSESSSPNRWKKSSSTGSGTKRTWRLRDLLRRSNSDGNMINTTNNIPKHTREGKTERSSNKIADHSAQIKGRSSVDTINIGASPSRLQSLHEVFYVRNKAAEKDGGRRKSYLPYRQNLVGIFASVNGMGKSYPFRSS